MRRRVVPRQGQTLFKVPTAVYASGLMATALRDHVLPSDSHVSPPAWARFNSAVPRKDLTPNTNMVSL
jgi:hypothetical protein